MRNLLCFLFLCLLVSGWYAKVEGYSCQSITVSGSPAANVEFGNTTGSNITSIALSTPTDLDIANNTGSVYTSPSTVVLSIIFNGSTCTAAVTGNNSYSSGPYNTYFKMLSGSNELPIYVSQDKLANLGAGTLTVVQNTQCFNLSSGQAGSVQCVEWTFKVPTGGLSDAIAGNYSLTLTVTATPAA